MAAEYVLKEGNDERDALRARDPHVRDRLPLHARPAGDPGAAASSRHLPVIVDPSHAPGRRDWVAAAVAGRRRGGRRRDHRRGPPRSRAGDLRRPAGARTADASPTTPSRSGGSPRSPARARRRSELSADRRSTVPMKIAVLGVGLIGGSIGLAARRRLERRGRGLRPGRRNAERALELGALDRAVEIGRRTRSPDAEVVFCAAPVGALPGLVAEALDGEPRATAVVTDVGSTKRALVEAVAAAPTTRALHRRPPARRAPRPPGSRTPAPTCSRARAGT